MKEQRPPLPCLRPRRRPVLLELRETPHWPPRVERGDRHRPRLPDAGAMVMNGSLRQDVEVEAAVLGSMLVNVEAATLVIDKVGLRSTEFAYDRNATIYTVV